MTTATPPEPTRVEILDAIDKVNKLLRLASNHAVNEHEKAVAEARIAALLVKYKLQRQGTRVWSDVFSSPAPSANPLLDRLKQRAAQGKQSAANTPPPPRAVFGLDGPPLSDDQIAALQSLLAALRKGDKVVSMSGLAGTGKTTLMRTVSAAVWNELGMVTVFCAPTGKAAVRLRESVKRPAATIHSILYRKVTEDLNGDPVFLDPDAPCPGNSLLVCDEASMVDEEIKDDIVSHLPLGASVLFVGDPRQLPPVNAPPGVDLQHPTAMLTTIHRQALDNEIVWAAHQILAGKHPATIQGTKGDYVVRRAAHYTQVDDFNLDRVAEWFAALRAENPDPAHATLLTFTNATCRSLNEKVRKLRGFAALDPVLTAGEIVVVGANHYDAGMMNGETFRVDAASPSRHPWVPEGTYDVVIEGEPFLLCPRLMGAKQGEWRKWVKDNVEKKNRNDWIHLAYGDCLTTHRSQGSQWDVVGLVWDPACSRMRADKTAEAISWAYTSVTRAAKRLELWKTDW